MVISLFPIWIYVQQCVIQPCYWFEPTSLFLGLVLLIPGLMCMLFGVGDSSDPAETDSSLGETLEAYTLQTYVKKKDFKKALEHLALILENEPEFLDYVQSEDTYAPLRELPEYQDLVKKYQED